MKKKTGFAALLLTCSLLLAVISVALMLGISGSEQPFTGVAFTYCQSLQTVGFPEDYAIALTKLHWLHPEWEFVPLKVTGTNSKYTWDYVIAQETKKADINLVPAGVTYQAYQHPTNTELYDSGYLQPSTAAVEYFMDPRNFLNEADIFQFYDLNASVNPSAEAVYAVIAGTFMEGLDVGNGMTCAEYLLQLGNELGIDPVFLAVKLRQEQGAAGTSPVISGNCGSLLWDYYRNQTQTTSTGRPVNPPASGRSEQELLALNGYYNPFNIKASGSGVFAIYENAMKHARANGWNTLWKGIRGGAEFLKNNYINNYQSTVYLQKFNVDGHVPDRNFAYQYMQNLAGAMSESRTLYQSFATNNTLDSACRFLIPVYDGMPEDPCADPAGGSCSSFAIAATKYHTLADLESPLHKKVSNDAVSGSVELTAADTLTVSGQFSHSYGVLRLEYSWDGTTWTEFSSDGTATLTFSGNLPDYGEHILTIRGEADYRENDSSRKANRYFLCATLDVTVIPPPSVTLTLQSGNAVSENTYYEGTEITLPVCTDAEFAGWIGSDGTFLPSGATLTLRKSVSYSALFLHLQALEGAALSVETNAPRLRFYAVLPEGEIDMAQQLPAGALTFTARGSVAETEFSTEGTVFSSLTASDGSRWREWSVDTAVLSAEEWNAPVSVTFAAELCYTDGTSKIINTAGSFSVRTASGVARAALNDPSAELSPSVRAQLEHIATSN